MSERRREDVDTLELLSRVTAAELRISILEAAANEPAPQETDEKTSGELASGECLPVGAAPTKAQALEALDSLDDFARMADIDPIGPRKTLEAYINGAAQLPDDVAKMVERLRNDHDRNYEDEAAGMLERQQRRIAELEAQREGMVLVPMEPTEGIREVIRNEHGAYGSEDELYSALIAAATKED